MPGPPLAFQRRSNLLSQGGEGSCGVVSQTLRRSDMFGLRDVKSICRLLLGCYVCSIGLAALSALDGIPNLKVGDAYLGQAGPCWKQTALSGFALGDKWLLFFLTSAHSSGMQAHKLKGCKHTKSKKKPDEASKATISFICNIFKRPLAAPGSGFWPVLLVPNSSASPRASTRPSSWDPEVCANLPRGAGLTSAAQAARRVAVARQRVCVRGSRYDLQGWWRRRNAGARSPEVPEGECCCP